MLGLRVAALIGIPGIGVYRSIQKYGLESVIRRADRKRLPTENLSLNKETVR